MTLITRDTTAGPLLTPSGQSFDVAQAIALRRMAMSTSDQPAYLLAPEITVLLDHFQDLRKRMLFDFLWNTGARINEALSVTPREIVLDAVKPFVILRTLKQRNQTAGRRGRPGKDSPVKRTVPLLDPQFARRLRDHLATFNRYVTRPVWEISDDTARNWLKEALQAATNEGVLFSIASITPHTFRHSFAMHLLYNRVHPKILQSFMGHRDYKSTEIYTRVFALDVAGQIGVRFGMISDEARALLQLLSSTRFPC